MIRKKTRVIRRKMIKLLPRNKKKTLQLPKRRRRNLPKIKLNRRKLIAKIRRTKMIRNHLRRMLPQRPRLILLKMEVKETMKSQIPNQMTKAKMRRAVMFQRFQSLRKLKKLYPH